MSRTGFCFSTNLTSLRIDLSLCFIIDLTEMKFIAKQLERVKIESVLASLDYLSLRLNLKEIRGRLTMRKIK